MYLSANGHFGRSRALAHCQVIQTIEIVNSRPHGEREPLAVSGSHVWLFSQLRRWTRRLHGAPDRLKTMRPAHTTPSLIRVPSLDCALSFASIQRRVYFFGRCCCLGSKPRSVFWPSGRRALLRLEASASRQEAAASSLSEAAIASFPRT